MMRHGTPPPDPWRKVVGFEFWRAVRGRVRCRLVLEGCEHRIDLAGRRLPARARCGVCGARAFVAWLFPLRIVGPAPEQN